MSGSSTLIEPSALAAIAQTPDWLPFDLDPASDRTILLRLDEEEYRHASFLDQRIVGPGAATAEADWQQVAAAIPGEARRDAQFIFHIGNVGSTLISRLLGELATVFALREPLLLRVFAGILDPAVGTARWPAGEAESRLDALRALLSRTWRPEQRAIVKATSFTSEIASRLAGQGSQALFLFAAPQPYLENILAGQNSRQTLEMLSPTRLQRLRRRCPGLEVELDRLSDARKAALGWACEMSSLVENGSALPAGVVLWLEFDRFLSEPTRHFIAVARHFGLSADEGAARAICTGPLMGRYSKALEYEFTPAIRQEILTEARWQHGPAIRDALGWLNDLAARYPAVEGAIRQSQQRG
jgi:hypothetical protein